MHWHETFLRNVDTHFMIKLPTSCPYRTIIQMRWYLLIRKILFIPDIRGVFAQNFPRKHRYKFYDDATQGLFLQDNNTNALVFIN